MKQGFFFKILMIVISLCVISLPAYLFLFGKKHKESLVLKNVIQKTTNLHPVSPRFFSDFLGLRPEGKHLLINRLDLRKINTKLKTHPVFKTILAEINHQGDLEILYDLRVPFAYLQDFESVAIDEKGHIFPTSHFFSPKKLPKVYAGREELIWSDVIDMTLIHKVINFFSNSRTCLEPIFIDISKISSPVSVHRELVVVIDFKGANHYLRIKPALIDLALSRYVKLFNEKKLQKLLAGDVVFDARIAKFATLKPIELSEKKEGSALDMLNRQ